MGNIHIRMEQRILSLKKLPKETTLAHVMSVFPDSFLSIGNLCDTGLNCTFTNKTMCTYDPLKSVIKLQGWTYKK